MAKVLHDRERGFTLIELLVVIAIIGILASIILASLSTAREQALNAKRISDLQALQSALELYYDDHHAYPLSAAWSSQCSGWSADVLTGALVPEYISTEPNDPQTNGISTNCYLYRTSASGQDYKLIDYNLATYVNIATEATYIDPARNSAYWTANGGSVCSSPVPAAAWGIWTSSVSQCY